MGLARLLVRNSLRGLAACGRGEGLVSEVGLRHFGRCARGRRAVDGASN